MMCDSDANTSSADGFKDSKCGFAKTHFGLGGVWGAFGGGGHSSSVAPPPNVMPPLRSCACRITYITEPPRKHKGYAGLWTRCVECRGWIEAAFEEPTVSSQPTGHRDGRVWERPTA